MARIQLQSRLNSYTTAIECIVTDQVTDKIPVVSSGRDEFDFLRNIRLADPISHIVGYRSADQSGNVLEFDMRWSRSSDKPNSPENMIGLDFGGSFEQHHTDRFKGSLISRLRN